MTRDACGELRPSARLRGPASLGAAVVVLASLGAGPAVADEPPAARLDVTVPAGCTDTFADELRRRAPDLRLAPDAPRTFRVRVVQDGDRVRGSLDVLERPVASGAEAASGATAPSTQRALDGAGCDEVLRGLALVAALAVGAAGADPPAAPPETSAAPAPAPPRPAAPPSSSPRRSRLRLGVGPSVELSTVAPAPALGLGAFVDLALERAPRALLEPSLRLRLATTLPTQASSTSGQGTFAWTFAALDGCPVRLGGTRLGARPCAGLDVGVLAAAGEPTGALASVEDRVRPWAAGRLLGRVDLVLASWMALELEGGAVVPFTRDTFVFRPTERLYTPNAAPFGAAGVRVTFP